MAEALRYKDKVTIVTGGSRGIGLGIVEVFVRNGAKVVIASNEEKEGKKAEEDMNVIGPGEACYIFCDVRNEEEIKNLVNKTIERYGKLDCLINNAGWHPPYQKIDDTSGDDVRKLFDLNFIAYFLMAKYCLPHLRKTKGNIIQTASIGTHCGQSGGSPYCATKGAISTFTKSLAIDEAGNGVRVNAFSPGAICTPLLLDLAEKSGNAKKMLKEAEDIHLLGRLGTPEEMGKDKYHHCYAMQRAFLTTDEVTALVQRLYGLSVTHIDELNSYDDVNLHIYVKNTSHNPNITHCSPGGYVLKILNTVDSTKVDFVDAMHASIFRCYEASILTPRPVPNRDGQYFSMEELSISKTRDKKQVSGNTGKATSKFLVRLFEYLPGELLQGKPCTVPLCYSVGKTAGKIDRALLDFHHPGYDGHARHWCLSRVESLLDKVSAVDNDDDRELIKEVVRDFKSNVVDRYHKLQRGVIHGDLNDQNLLVLPNNSLDGLPVSKFKTESEEPKPEIYCVHGVLDFGDSVLRYHVFDIAIAIMYMMIQNESLDPLDVGGITLAGYLSEFQLPSFDLTVLKECVCGRFAQSLVYGAYEYKMDPSNKYFLQTANKGWPLLRRLWGIPKIQLYKQWQATLDAFDIAVKLDYGNEPC